MAKKYFASREQIIQAIGHAQWGGMRQWADQPCAISAIAHHAFKLPKKVLRRLSFQIDTALSCDTGRDPLIAKDPWQYDDGAWDVFKHTGDILKAIECKWEYTADHLSEEKAREQTKAFAAKILTEPMYVIEDTRK